MSANRDECVKQKIANEIAAFIKLKPLIRYDAEQGRVFWAVSPGKRVKIGDEIGVLVHNGYRRFRFQKNLYRTHRLIWWLEKGVLPDLIDHCCAILNERGERDNRIANLRESTGAASQAYRQHRKRNKLGVKGVTQRGSRFRAHIQVNGKLKALGTFDTIEEAASAYNEAASQKWQ
ncbi:Fis family transcriptional regulator [Enterobacteriaceae bacterium A-F18]|jgi:hypothetical protein|nr:Fis family transcriptional regulator [Enterobacteriaceae bacterium ENNIH3]AUV09606.1 Fis family transcriptional regulator [Enterobacteriaceae bacterium ENNIH2]PWF51238.1 Fis family transcriptional regulator [[Kluyvera] intestini]QIH64194.1 Fis family transcriptional regulator [Enterobacteriaceae bacterium A-F18]TCW42676.1 AP2 domain-containing protein [Phytobacter diazotrophicus]SLJ95776.1 AP2 domain-containing protein [Enterobacter sp. NFR05]BBE78600.1 hypothetical protein MRY16398_36560 